MKTFFTLTCQKKFCAVLSLILFVLILQAQDKYKFKNPVLVSGTDLAVGSVYRFDKVETGVDALVEVKNFVGGVSLSAIDDNSTGFNNAFQPFINSPANTNGHVEFEIKFVITGTSTAIIQTEVPVTPIDIDGNEAGNIFEKDELNLNGGYVNYDALGGELSVTPQPGNWFRGINIAGIGYPGIDTLVKGVMFTVVNSNISSLTARVGVDNQSSDDVVRYRSLYFRNFQYPNSPLPVKLISFTALLNADKVNLKWTTASEMNVSHFEVEKSTDGKNFNTTGEVTASGNTTAIMNYSFADDIENIQSSVIYYRLKSVDIDGKAEFSVTRIIRLKKQETNGLTILTFPNPVSNELRITIPLQWQGRQVTYEVLNSNGTIAKKSIISTSSQTETISINNLAPGFYIVRTSCNGERAQQKIIKQ